MAVMKDPIVSQRALDFIFIVTDLDQKNCRVRASPLFILGWNGMLMNRCAEC